MSRLTKFLPGFALSFAVALVAVGLAHWLPQLGGATIAILLGIVLGNTLCRDPRLGAGTKLAESRLLEYSVVLLGLTVTFQTIAHMGWRGLVYVLLMMTTVICGAYLLGRRLGFGEQMSLMFAGGNAVCGSSAIGAIAPAIGADDREKGEAITLVNLLGTVMMLSLPFLGQAIFGKSLLATSALLGGTLQSVGQVVAGASLLSPQVVAYAMLFKITRIIMLVVVVTLFTQKVRRSRAVAADVPPVAAAETAPAGVTDSDAAAAPGAALPTKTHRRLPVPWYVLGFLILCMLNSALPLPTVLADGAHFVSTWFETTALAAIGLRLNFRAFMRQGRRFLAYGLGVGALQTVAALTFLKLLAL
ncbi:YeiH family protein [Lacticaseibacillus kribbianus]|uniref:YeiH family protein n=1 Tax=Lacticaseibacillus kribbianus TaxID=2926292 RepID=UPI001CD3D634|nr:putative sulfate exporter family transporter [Lacticaseibacillus kribbianus]